MTANDISISTCQSDGIDAIGLQTCYEVFVDQPTIHHRHNFQHIAISDAASVDHLCLNTQSLSHLRGLATSAMYQHLATLNSREVA